MDKITNEQLCIAAQGGDKWAENALVENNLQFIRKDGIRNMERTAGTERCPWH